MIFVLKKKKIEIHFVFMRFCVEISVKVYF